MNKHYLVALALGLLSASSGYAVEFFSNSEVRFAFSRISSIQVDNKNFTLTGNVINLSIPSIGLNFNGPTPEVTLIIPQGSLPNGCMEVLSSSAAGMNVINKLLPDAPYTAYPRMMFTAASGSWSPAPATRYYLNLFSSSTTACISQFQ